MSNTIINHKLHKQIYDIDLKEAEEDLIKLENVNIKNISQASRLGSKFVDYFTSYERMTTKSRKGINFFDFWSRKSELSKKNYVRKLFKYYHSNNPNYPDYLIWWRFFNLYYGSINQFRPIIAMNIYYQFKPTSILDFTMGWGGRLVGACALDIPHYIGIDLNKKLETPYKNMIDILKKHSKTDIKVFFKDSLDVDYSKLDYDMVFTSPPYYNIELYSGTNKKSIDEWDEQFYKPIITKTWTHLKTGGHYCLNVPQDVYNRVCLDILGKAHYFIRLVKSKRTTNEKYKEFIYVWKKK